MRLSANKQSWGQTMVEYVSTLLILTMAICALLRTVLPRMQQQTDTLYYSIAMPADAKSLVNLLPERWRGVSERHNGGNQP